MEGTRIEARVLDEMMTRNTAKPGGKKRRKPSTERAPRAWEPIGRLGRKG